MRLREWEIWHTYSSHLQQGRLDLAKLQDAMVREGLVYAAMHRDGVCSWRDSRGEIRSGSAEVRMQASGDVASIALPRDDTGENRPEGFAFEALYQATRFRFSELRVFSEAADIPPPYIRAYLGEVRLTREAEEPVVGLYPTLLI